MIQKSNRPVDGQSDGREVPTKCPNKSGNPLAEDTEGNRSAKKDFDIPMFVHNTVPPGMPDMKRLRGKIRYSFEETPTGGRVVMATADKEASHRNPYVFSLPD